MNYLRELMPETPAVFDVEYVEIPPDDLALSPEGTFQEPRSYTMKKIAIGAFALSPLSAFAALDVTPITAAQTDLLAAAAALLALGVAVWGAMKVVKMFGGK